MITGVVNEFREATVRLIVLDRDGNERTVETILDTGFNGSLTLPLDLVAALRLRRRSRSIAVLADGRRERFDVYAATVIWDGAARNVLIQAIDAAPLLGMGLLEGHDLHVEVVIGGAVTIERRASSAT
jgi:clan AA aspartic protease